ncbi:MAG: hypothetical protein ACK5B9_05220 [Flavobacteriia bacterium]|jgi:hypothetical protein
MINTYFLKKDKVLSFRTNIDVIQHFNLVKKIQDLITEYETKFCIENNVQLTKNQTTRLNEKKSFSKWIDLADNH